MNLVSELGKRFKAELVARIVSVLSGGILVITLARLLTPDSYGLLYLAISVFAVAGFLSRLGIAKSTARYITKYKEEDSTQLSHILWFSFLMSLVAITVTALALFFGSDLIASFLNEPGLVPFLLLGVLFVAFRTLTNWVRRILQGFESIREAAALQAGQDSIRMVAAIGLVLLGYGALGALIGYILSFGFVAITSIGYVYVKYYRELERGEREDGLRRRILEYSVPLTATGSANMLQNRVDTILIGFFIGPLGVAFYTVSEQLLQFIETPISALGFTLSPTYEAQVAKGNPDTAARIYENALSYGLLLYIPAAVGLILVAEPLMNIVFGQEYRGAVPVVQVLAVWSVFESVSKITSNGLDYLGRARARSIIVVVTSLLNFALNIILIPRIGVVGAAAATVLSAALYTLGCLYLIHLELDIRVRWLVQHLTMILAITIVMAGFVYLLLDYITGLLTLILVVCFGVVVWFGLSLQFGLFELDKLKRLVY